MMTNLVDKLHAYDCLQDFVNLVKLLENGIMSPLIIAFFALMSLGPTDIGDINLWGLEKPSIAERKEKEIDGFEFHGNH